MHRFRFRLQPGFRLECKICIENDNNSLALDIGGYDSLRAPRLFFVDVVTIEQKLARGLSLQKINEKKKNK